MAETKINESILNDEIKEHLKENRINHMEHLPGMEVLEDTRIQSVLQILTLIVLSFSRISGKISSTLLSR